MTRQELPASPSPLVAYRNLAPVTAGRLHVYLDGDGTPWITRTQISADPTPRNPVALHLMALDPAPALYLARPCYNGTAGAEGCGPWYWTSGRYSQTVLDAMESALRHVMNAEAVTDLVLIGYSGGGVLAWLLAQRIMETRALVTVAANLDVDAWTRLHGYTPLRDSLNPAAGAPMRAGVEQWHLVGRTDRTVPPTLIEAFRGQLSPRARIVPVEAGHHCCWERVWPDILRQLP